MRLAFDRQLRTFVGPHRELTLLGGSPRRLMRLSGEGSDVVRAWMTGAPVSNADSQQHLAGRLLDTGIAHLERPGEHGSDKSAVNIGSGLDMAVVVPVLNDAAGLAHTLDSLAGLLSAGASITVVDDGSTEPVTAPPEVRLLRHSSPLGPAAARNAGTEGSDHHVLLFVDAGVSVSPTDMHRLSHNLTQGSVAVAPRIRSTPGSTLIERYETIRNPLDMGTDATTVGPGRRMNYVPTAVFMVDRTAFDAVGGFDQSLRFGEDVDLCWRLTEVGSIRYDPSVEAWHPPRENLRQLWSQRVGYGSAAEPLARRHGSIMTHYRTDRYGASIALLCLFGPAGRLLAVVVWATRSNLAGKELARRAPDLHGAREAGTSLAARGLANAVFAAANNAGRVWWPISLIGLVSPFRRPVAAAVAAGWSRHLRLRSPGLVALGVLDDLAYGTGVWKGMLRTKSVRSILPQIGSQADQF